MKQIFITADQLSKGTALAEIIEAVFPECEIRVVVGEGLKAGHEKTSGGASRPFRRIKTLDRFK